MKRILSDGGFSPGGGGGRGPGPAIRGSETPEYEAGKTTDLNFLPRITLNVTSSATRNSVGNTQSDP